MKNKMCIIIILITTTSLMSQSMITRSLILSEYVTMTYDSEDWLMMTLSDLERATETRTVTKNTIYIGGLYNEDKSRQVLVKYKAMSTVGIANIEDVYINLKEMLPSAAIENRLNAVVMDKLNDTSIVFIKVFKAGFLYIAIHDIKSVDYETAVDLASYISIKEEYRGAATKYDEIEWQKVFIAGIKKALSP